MPLYDFKCRSCGVEFEALVLKSQPVCPSCAGAELEQLISLFSVDSADTRQSHLTVERRHNAKGQRDKMIAEAESIRNHHD